MMRYHITATLDPRGSTLTAQATLHLDGAAPAAKLVLHIHPHLQVTRAAFRGDECRFAQAEAGRVEIGLPADTGSAPPILDLAYAGRLAQADDAGEPARAFIGEEFFWLREDQLWFPVLADRQEELRPVPPGRYRVDLHLPEGWEAAAAAPLIRRWQESSCECYRWDTGSEQPGLSVVGGRLHRYIVDRCTFLWPTPRLDLAEIVLDALGFCEALLGPRPCADLTVVVGPGYVPGGYADRGLIYVGENKLTARTLAHELAHQWWGRGVEARQHGDRWITEGLAGYLALLYAEARGEPVLAATLEQYRADYRQAVAAWGDKPLAEVSGEDYGRPGLISALIYKKGVWLHRMLHWLLGERYFPALREIGARYGGRSITTGQYLAALADVCPAQRNVLAAFAQQWLAAPGLPECDEKEPDL